MASRRIPRTTAVDRAACQAAVAACVEAGCAVWINLVDGAVEVHAADWTGIDETAVAQAVADAPTPEAAARDQILAALDAEPLRTLVAWVATQHDLTREEARTELVAILDAPETTA